MLKKLLIILPLILVFELLVYFVQAQKIRELDQKAQFLKMADRQVTAPTHSFGELLTYDLEPEVLGVTTEDSSGVSLGFPEVAFPKKQSYLIAAIGDSMVDTMGDSLDYLKAELKEKYPGTEFAMYNYGLGAEKVTSALARFDKPFSFGAKNYPPLAHLKPDVLIVGSYAYNPFDEYSRDGHWLALADLAARARMVTPNVYMLAEIAPLEKDFGKGPGGVNWPDSIVAGHVPKIIEQLENAIGISKVLGIPLINVYDKTRVEGSKYGKSEFVNPHDNIHPSVWGHVFTAQEIANAIKLD